MNNPYRHRELQTHREKALSTQGCPGRSGWKKSGLEFLGREILAKQRTMGVCVEEVSPESMHGGRGSHGEAAELSETVRVCRIEKPSAQLQAKGISLEGFYNY